MLPNALLKKLLIIETIAVDLNHPVIESIFLPLVLTLALIASLQWNLGARWGKLIAGASIGMALLVADMLIFGLPVWPARSGMQKLPLILLLILVGGMFIDIVKPARIVVAAATTAAIPGIAMWLGWPQLESGDAGVILLLAVTSLVALLCLAGVVHAQPESANRPAMIVLAALGLAGASFNAGSLALFQIALALAAAVGGFALWNWPRPRLAFAGSGVSVGMLGCFALALLLLLLTQIRPWMISPLPLIFVSDVISRRLPVPVNLRRTTIEPLYIAAIGAVPLILSILLTEMPAASQDIYYR